MGACIHPSNYLFYVLLFIYLLFMYLDLEFNGCLEKVRSKDMDNCTCTMWENPIVDLPFVDGLYKPFLVISGIVWDCL